MPHTFRFAPDQNLVVLEVSGVVDGDDLVDVFNLLLDEPGWVPGMNVVWDGVSVAQLVLSPPQMDMMLAFIRHNKPRIGPGRSAIVVVKEMHAAVMRLWSIRVGREANREVKVFERAGDALAWIGGTPLPS